jgi:1-deoxy-D-xylulose-5-phosphate synthase
VVDGGVRGAPAPHPGAWGGSERPPTPDLAILAFGTLAFSALDAAASLGVDYSVSVYDARFAKPVDLALLQALLERNVPILTIEDHSLIGGFGAAVLEAAQELGLDTSRIQRLGLPDGWVYQDSRSRQLAETGLDAPGIARSIRSLLADAPAAHGPASAPHPTSDIPHPTSR